MSREIPRLDIYSRMSGGGGKADLPVPKSRISAKANEREKMRSSSIKGRNFMATLTRSWHNRLKDLEPILTPSLLLPFSSSTQCIRTNRINIPQKRTVLDENDTTGYHEPIGQMKPFIVEFMNGKSRSGTLVVCVEEIGQAA
jgi:hypothetical protein